MIAPWMIKDWIYVHNPVAPFANEYFPESVRARLDRAEWAQWLRRYDMANLWTLPMEVTDSTAGRRRASSDWCFCWPRSALLALAISRGPAATGAGLLMLATYFGNIGTRFLIPCVPFLRWRWRWH